MPFIIADCIIIGVLHFLEQRMKAQKVAIKTVENAHHEDDKKTSMALKKAQRDEQRRVQQQNKSGLIGPTTHMNPQINQPDKTK